MNFSSAWRAPALARRVTPALAGYGIYLVRSLSRTISFTSQGSHS